MRKIYLAVLGLLLAGNILAQPTITKNDMPAVGDTIWLKTTALAQGVDYQQTGNNFTWDFSGLTGTPAADTFVSLSSTSFTLQLSFGLGSNPANVAQNTADLSFVPGIPLSGLTNFYRSSTASFQLNGYGLGIYGIGLPIKFSGADVWYKFPLTINSPADSSVSNYSQSLLTLGYLKIYKKRVNTVDGWGTMITPYGSFQTLRVKSVVYEEDSIYLDTINIGIPIVRNYTEYKWLANGYHAPVMQVTEELGIPAFRWIDEAVNVGINQVEETSRLTVSPNPTTGPLSISLFAGKSSMASIKIYNVHGQTSGDVFRFLCAAGNNNFNIDLDRRNYPPGLYILKIDLDNHSLTYKFIID